MSQEKNASYIFKSFRLDVRERSLSSDGEPVVLTPKAFDVLTYLVRHSGHLVEKETLMEAVWRDSFVDQSSVARVIHTLRRSLGEDENGNKFIETVATKGYRFVAKVETVSEEEPGDQLSSENRHELNGADHVDPISIPVDQPVDPKRRRFRLMASSRIAAIFVAVGITLLIAGYWLVNRSWNAMAGDKPATPQTYNGEAWQNFQQGRVLMERGNKGDRENALANFETAIKLDPFFAAAHAGKADAKMWLFWGSPGSGHDNIVRARAAIDKAIELDESSSYAHTVSCRLKATYDWDFAGAKKECARAIFLNPNDYEAHKEMAFYLNSIGQEDDALHEIDTAIAIGPTTMNKRARGMILYYSRHYDEAIEQFKQIKETDQGYSEVRSWLMSCYQMKGDYANAVDARIFQLEQAGAPPEEIEATRAAFEKDGWPGVLKSIVEPKPPVGGSAMFYAQLGNADKAFDALEKAFERHAVMLVQTAREPRYDPIRNDPRFDALLKRIGLK